MNVFLTCLPPLSKTLGKLEAQLLENVERFDRGEGVDGEEVFRRLWKRIKKARRTGKVAS